ncbi:helicase superfamily 3 (plasmid) [Calothrix sp. PCC 7716]|nr:helicase superfamily 3 [Calothrix sp. PCC 7716]
MSTATFDIRNFVDSLVPNPKCKGKYICPACGGNDLQINEETGKYKCFNGCENKDVREAIKPWSEVVAEKKAENPNAGKIIPTHQKKTITTPKSAPIPEGELVLVRMDVPSDIPQSQLTDKELIYKKTLDFLIDKGATTEELNRITVTTYNYGDGKKVYRYEASCAAADKGHVKTFRQGHENANGEFEWNKGDKPWPAYRLNEVIENALNVQGIPILLLQEGEGCVEIARGIGLGNFTFQGSNWSAEEIKRELQLAKDELPEAVLVFLRDQDNAGEKKAKTVSECCNVVGLPFIEINPLSIYPDLPSKGDIKEILAAMNEEEFIRRLEEEIHAAVESRRQKQEEHENIFSSPDGFVPNHTLNQQAFNFIFGDKKWICADDRLYVHEGNYYKEVKDSVLKKRITPFCNSYVEEDKHGNIDYPYARSSAVEEVLKWAKLMVIVDPDLLNPPGINCTNGIVRIDWSSGKPVRKLIPHSVDEYYTYEPLVKYDPDAETLNCDRLLRCLNESQQQVLLRNLAASLDLQEVRKRRGREVRLILACGLGSNGKDSIRQVVSTIFGHKGMTGATVADFAAYDEGRKFSLASLKLSRINWASENPQTCRIDKIQSLKAFATGDTLYSERKGIDPDPYTPLSIGIFNFNDVPPLQGTVQAIQDRLAVLEFTKTFKIRPDSRNPNELQADPRFAYDPDFVKEQVAPAFLNKMLDALSALIEEGIDYSCTTVAFSSMQKENNHLFQFCEDTGLQYDTESSVSGKELWAAIEQWYQDTGTLTIDPTSGRREWVDQSRPSDKNIKGINQVLPRIAALFPKATKTTQYDPVSKRNVQVLRGIGFVENTRTTVENFRTSSASVAAPEIDTQQASRTTRTSFDKLESEKDIGSEKNQNEKNAGEGNQSPPQSDAGDAETKHSKDSDCGSGAGSGAGNVNNGAGNVNKRSNNVSEQIKQTWNDKSALGKLILSIADTIELDAFVVTLTNEEIKYIKSAAKLTWRPGCDSFGEYRGEKCELIEFGTNMRTWKVRPVSGTSQIKVSVFDVAPWLGI